MEETAPKRGRPASFDRAAAVEAAMQLFCRRGFLGVSASDLAEAMALQRSSFYNSFGSREDVFEEALARYAEVAPDAAFDRVRPGEPVLPVIAATFREVCRLRTRRHGEGCLVSKCASEAEGMDARVAQLVDAAVKSRTASLERLLRQAVAQGEASGIDCRLTALSLMALLLGIPSLARVVPDARRMWAMCRQVLQAQGLRVPDGD